MPPRFSRKRRKSRKSINKELPVGLAEAQTKPETDTMPETVAENGKLENHPTYENAKDINILLLGCTGVGKSTFINSFVNYLTHTDFETALSEKLVILIPTRIRVTDQHGESREIRVGPEDHNEHIKTGDAQTQHVKTYVFPIDDKNVNIRLIDTPGMADPRGIQQDDINCENILSYIGNLKQLHAICLLLKPNESRDTVLFKYCINQIFSRLEKSACNNIIFCFTHTRGTDYSPGETIDVLKKNIEEIKSKPPHASIPTDRNIFCFDNEGFRCLAGLKESVDFDDSLVDRNMESWRKSVKECWKLYHYIAGDKHNPPIKPHQVRSTEAVNEARRLINRLAKPLADVVQLIQDNIYVLERHAKNLAVEKESLNEMKDQLYIPVISLEPYPLKDPTTVCTARECAEFIQVGGKTKWHYKQRCHEPCGLGGVVAKEIVGDPQLLQCAAIDSSTGICIICGCNFKVHMHVYYLTKQVEKKEADPNVLSNITTKIELMKSKTIFLRNLEKRQDELQQEHQVIIESSAKFAHFLQNNAITPFSDSYKQYIEYLIEREKSLGQLCNADTLNRLKTGLEEYVQMKNQFDKALQDARHLGHVDVINPQDVTNCFKRLFELKHYGAKIKELYELQDGQIIKHQTHKEYVHNTPASFKNFLNRKEVKGKSNKESGEEIEEKSCTCKHCKPSFDQNNCDEPVHQSRNEQHYKNNAYFYWLYQRSNHLQAHLGYPYPHLYDDAYNPRRNSTAHQTHHNPFNKCSERSDPPSMNKPKKDGSYVADPTQYHPDPRETYNNKAFLPNSHPAEPHFPQFHAGYPYFPQLHPEHSSFYHQLPNYPQTGPGYSSYPNFIDDTFNQRRNFMAKQNSCECSHQDNRTSLNADRENESTKGSDQPSVSELNQYGNNESDPTKVHPDPRELYHNNDFPPNFYPGNLHFPPLYPGNSYLPHLPLGNPHSSPLFTEHPSFHQFPYYPQPPPGYSSHPHFPKRNSSVNQNSNECSFQENRSTFNSGQENESTKKSYSVNEDDSDCASYESSDEQEYEITSISSEIMKEVGYMQRVHQKLRNWWSLLFLKQTK